MSDGLWQQTKIILTKENLKELEAASLLLLEEARAMKRRGGEVNNITIMMPAINLLGIGKGVVLAHYIEDNHRGELYAPDIEYQDLRIL